MRLCDRIQSHQSRERKPGCRGLAEQAILAVADTPVRYVLEQPVTDHCLSLVRAGHDLLTPDNKFLAMPTADFWVEWVIDQGGGANARWGALVRCDSRSGRSGYIMGFVSEGDGVRQSRGHIIFDLDRILHRAVGDRSIAVISHSELGTFNTLLRHMLLVIDDLSAADAERQQIAEELWYLLPFALAFSVLLQLQSHLQLIPQDMTRLNRARARCGKIPLLDHYDVRLNLDRNPLERSRRDSRNSMFVTRAMRRLHQVRGHIVVRGGKPHWRRPHVRGDASCPMATKTVRVTMDAHRPWAT